jgi:nucleoside-diphosphate-sugar epimerase
LNSDEVLVTGACGLVGAATVERLTAEGRPVVATDIDSPTTRKAARAFPSAIDVRYVDLTDDIAVERLVAASNPVAIIHLAAIIPPFIYARREAARRVNVGGTAALVKAAERLAKPPRFVMASSVAVYGARNPHRTAEVLAVDTPLNPTDLYGGHKVEAERLVRNARLDWVILRLGGVVSTDPSAQSSLDNMYLERLLPDDGRVQTVDVRDVAAAFAAATTADVVGETLLIGGDDTHRLRQGAVGASMAGAMGLVNGLPVGLKGDPESDSDWFSTDWMDTARAQKALDFQHHSWPDVLADITSRAGWKRGILRLAAPLARQVLARRSAYHGSGLRYADPWGAVGAKWGDPGLDESTEKLLG